ncbi:M15 family metallopeptidase [Treponema sp. OMZ 792]|uniref:M15 family metallopeptidase n=1 Tax=unclassified Treponema TaxID=2638727 RepID=UPI0020A387B8|nr:MULTISPECIES: M15 family metallopeptidase [unclassified Treponema]UTC74647.1 M15 family metallopeptidase [Treponema sp. OMZ 792]UTC81044.1 M15 family metallopeptidase [Treponema sp. OMZ 798]
MHSTLKKYFFLSFFFILILCIYPNDKTDSDENVYKKNYVEFSKILPQNIRDKINKNKKKFFKDLNKVLAAEKEGELILVDKKHLLDNTYKPKNVILLFNMKDRKYLLDRFDIYLAKIAERPLQKMAEAAKKDGIKIWVSSAYRPYNYQSKLFARYVRVYGKKKALSFSAPPGASQHQLGTVVDFGSISNSYADTAAGKWMFNNAWRFGWSLSYPKDMEHITGYKWESWHYRYLGVEACKFQKEWFGDIQQYMLEFIDLWKKEKAKLN